jgi:protein-arginine kinase activator protein McsA
MTLTIHPEVHTHKQFEHPDYSTCHTCHRTFHGKNEDQISLQLCDECLEAVQSGIEPTPCVHVKARPYHQIKR